MFKEVYFQYDGKSSQDFGLKIATLGGSSITSDMLGIPLEIEEDKIKRNPKPFFFGVEALPKLNFKLQLIYLPQKNDGVLREEMTRGEMGAVFKWLLKREYKEFKIIDSDYSNITYNAMFQNPKQIEISNYAFGIEVDVVCDRPYGIRSQTISKTVNGSLTFNLKNLSFDNDDIYPEVEILNTVSGDFSIRNVTDNNKTMQFTNLETNETVYTNTRRQEIISSTGLNRSSDNNFNFKWFRLTPDYYNNIVATGNGTVTFRFEFPMPI